MPINIIGNESDLKVKISILTEAPHGTLGDVSAARKLIDLLHSSFEIIWYIKVKGKTIKADGLLREGIETYIVEKWDDIFNEDIIAPLESSRIIIPFPTFHYLNKSNVSRLEAMNGIYLPIPEYNFENDECLTNIIIKTGFGEGLGIFIQDSPVTPKSLTDPILLSHIASDPETSCIPLYFCYLNSSGTSIGDVEPVYIVKQFLSHALYHGYKFVRIIAPFTLEKSGDEFVKKYLNEKFGTNNINYEIINNFPLSKNDFQHCLENAEFVSVTGDQSFTEALNREKVFLYQVMPWKKHLFYNFLKLIAKALSKDSKLFHFYLNQIRCCDSEFVLYNEFNIIDMSILVTEHFYELQKEIKILKEYVLHNYNLTLNLPKKIHEVLQISQHSSQENNTEYRSDYSDVPDLLDLERVNDERTCSEHKKFIIKFDMADMYMFFKDTISGGSVRLGTHNKSFAKSKVDKSTLKQSILFFLTRSSGFISIKFDAYNLDPRLNSLAENLIKNLPQNTIDMIANADYSSAILEELDTNSNYKTFTIKINSKTGRFNQSREFDDFLKKDDGAVLRNLIESDDIKCIKTILHYLSDNPDSMHVLNFNKINLLDYAASFGNVKIVKLLLKFHKYHKEAPLSPRIHGYSGLLKTCLNNDSKTLHTLLKQVIKKRDSHIELGENVLNWLKYAIFHDYKDLASCLLHYIYKYPTLEVNLAENNFDIIGKAVKLGKLEMVKQLYCYYKKEDRYSHEFLYKTIIRAIQFNQYDILDYLVVQQMHRSEVFDELKTLGLYWTCVTGSIPMFEKVRSLVKEHNKRKGIELVEMPEFISFRIVAKLGHVNMLKVLYSIFNNHPKLIPYKPNSIHFALFAECIELAAKYDQVHIIDYLVNYEIHNINYDRLAFILNEAFYKALEYSKVNAMKYIAQFFQQKNISCVSFFNNSAINTIALNILVKQNLKSLKATIEILDKLKIRYGVDNLIEELFDGAFKRGSDKVIKFLIQEDMNEVFEHLRFIDSDVLNACKYGHIEIIKILLENIVNNKKFVNLQPYTLTGYKPMYIAAKYSQFEIVKLLLAFDDKMNISNEIHIAKTTMVLYKLFNGQKFNVFFHLAYITNIFESDIILSRVNYSVELFSHQFKKVFNNLLEFYIKARLENRVSMTTFAKNLLQNETVFENVIYKLTNRYPIKENSTYTKKDIFIALADAYNECVCDLKDGNDLEMINRITSLNDSYKEQLTINTSDAVSLISKFDPDETFDFVAKTMFAFRENKKHYGDIYNDDISSDIDITSEFEDDSNELSMLVHPFWD